MKSDKNESGPANLEDSTGAAAETSVAERKRRAARRRFLIGGAAAVPVVFTVRRAQAAITWTECADQLGGQSGQGTSLVPGLRKERGSFADDFPPCQEMEDMLNEMESSSEPSP